MAYFGNAGRGGSSVWGPRGTGRTLHTSDELENRLYKAVQTNSIDEVKELLRAGAEASKLASSYKNSAHDLAFSEQNFKMLSLLQSWPSPGETICVQFAFGNCRHWAVGAVRQSAKSGKPHIVDFASGSSTMADVPPEILRHLNMEGSTRLQISGKGSFEDVKLRAEVGTQEYRRSSVRSASAHLIKLPCVVTPRGRGRAPDSWMECCE